MTDRPASEFGDGTLIEDNENPPIDQEIPNINNEHAPTVNENLPAINEEPAALNGNPQAVDGNSTTNIENSPVLLSPEQVRPFPKAGPRQQNRRGRKKKQTAILTDTPIKEALKEEKDKAKEKKQPLKRKIVEKKCTSNKKDGRKFLFRDEMPVASTSRVSRKSSSSESEDETECLFCEESYRSSVTGDDWVQCTQCRRWAHEKCTKSSNLTFYVCINCNSDDDL